VVGGNVDGERRQQQPMSALAAIGRHPDVGVEITLVVLMAADETTTMTTATFGCCQPDQRGNAVQCLTARLTRCRASAENTDHPQ